MPVTHLIIAIAATVSTASAQAAPQVAQPPTVVVGTKQAAAEKPVCKSMSTGNLVPKRICMPASEWAKVEGHTEGNLNSLREGQRMRCNIGTNC